MQGGGREGLDFDLALNGGSAGGSDAPGVGSAREVAEEQAAALAGGDGTG